MPSQACLFCLAVFSFLLGCSDDRLHQAVAKDQVLLVQRLINDGVDANTRDRGNNTPLHYVMSIQVAEVLIQNGADIHAKNNFGDTPLHLSAFWGDGDVVDLLIRSGADVNAKNHDDEIPLHWSVINMTSYKYADQMKYLFQHRVTLQEGKRKITRLFLKMGVSPNSRSNTGETPLHYAVIGCSGTAEILLENGADANAQDNNGRTPAVYARPLPEVLELLKRYGAKGI